MGVVRRFLSYLPASWRDAPPAEAAREPKPTDLRRLVPVSERQAFDMRRYVPGLVDQDSLFEIHALWARQLVVGFARLDGRAICVVSHNPTFKSAGPFLPSPAKGPPVLP